MSKCTECGEDVAEYTLDRKRRCKDCAAKRVLVSRLKESFKDYSERWLLGLVFVVVVFLFRYDVQASGKGAIYRLDRLTGEVCLIVAGKVRACEGSLFQ